MVALVIVHEGTYAMFRASAARNVSVPTPGAGDFDQRYCAVAVERTSAVQANREKVPLCSQA